MKKLIKYYIFLGLIGFAFSEKSSEDIQKEINTNNKKLDNLEKTIIEIEKEINSIESSEKDLSKNIKKINEKIAYREQQIEILKEQDESIKKLINKTEKEIEDKEDKLSSLKLKLEKRAIYLYKYGKTELLSKIMIEDNWDSALNKLKYLKILLEYEKDLNKKIKTTIKDLKGNKEKLIVEKNTQKKILQEAKNIYNKLKSDKKSKVEKIEKIKNDKNNLTKDMISKKKEISKIQQLINQQISDVKAAKKREEELARKRSNQNKATTGNFAKMKGKLNWPTNGTVIGKFGMQTNSKLNTITENIGIDIKTVKSSPVRTVLDGIVVGVNYIAGYGKLVIIDHGGEYYTVYANLDNINVNEDDYVSTNTQIATTAKSEVNYKLNFQVLNKNEHLNPEIWLKKK